MSSQFSGTVSRKKITDAGREDRYAFMLEEDGGKEYEILRFTGAVSPGEVPHALVDVGQRIHCTGFIFGAGLVIHSIDDIGGECL